ncbi:MAG TPA: hypothetical protein PKL31_09665 [Fulvivirga sp.]|nr:hypothetical protein [Fulvivirga sp.]
MKKTLLIILLLFPIALFAQGEKKKKFAIKKPNLRIGEKLGNLAGNMMTSKTDNLAETAPVASLISGIYDLQTNTSESKYFPDGTKEGDHVATITFMKQEGVGMYQIKGDVSCNDHPMEYVGLGSYAYTFDEPLTAPRTINIKTETGQEGSFTISPIAEIEILSINDDPTIPIIDLTEDLNIKFTNPEEYDGATIRVGLLTDVAGARAFNFFADFPAKKGEVIIPHEAFSNLEINGALGAGNVNKGNSYIILERKIITEKSDMPDYQKADLFPSATIQAISYATKPVIVKGKQENGVIATLNFSGGHRKTLGYEVYKPNARTGLPFSRASKFGLLSMTVNGKTYKKESESSSSSYTIGNTRYTSTRTTTTTYEFPQLPNEYWDAMMDDFYKKMTAYFKNQMNVDFVPVEKITSSPEYDNLFTFVENNSEKSISKSYKNTKRASASSIGEILGSLSSSKSSENPSTNMMKNAGVDGLVTMEINFEIGGNSEGKVVLLPTVKFNISGMDETKGNRQGTYANGYISYRQGVPFNGDLAKSDPTYLSNILNIDNIISCMSYMLDNLKIKEVAMGYDEIWSIGE